MGCPCEKKPDYKDPGADGRPRYAVSDPFRQDFESAYRAGFEIGSRRMKKYIE